ncbi:protein of unknown function (plasmid) [Shinella sp. WSC3-e]|nr:protein of unknown function [Shinella sp. WSC3-e]
MSGGGRVAEDVWHHRIRTILPATPGVGLCFRHVFGSFGILGCTFCVYG